MSYRIHIPPPICPVDVVTRGVVEGVGPVTLCEWFVPAFVGDTRPYATANGVMLLHSIIGRLREAEAQSEVVMPADEYKLMRSMVEEPSSGYLPRVALAYVAFIRAVLDAELVI